MNSGSKLVVLDFCGTVVGFQTLNPFLLYVLKHNKPVKYRIFRVRLVEKVCDYLTNILRKRGYTGYLYKGLLVYLTKGIKEEILYDEGKRFYIDEIHARLIGPVAKVVKNYEKLEYHIILLSGGSKYYIKYYCEEFGIDDFITAEIIMENGKSAGRLGRTCFGIDKIKELDKFLKYNHYYKDVYDVSITDSKSDLKLLEKSKKKIVVSHLQKQNWTDESMEEIVWK